MVFSCIQARIEYLNNRKRDTGLNASETIELENYDNTEKRAVIINKFTDEFLKDFTLPTFLQISKMVGLIKRNLILLLILNEEIMIMNFIKDKSKFNKRLLKYSTRLQESGINYYFSSFSTYQKLNEILLKIYNERDTNIPEEVGSTLQDEDIQSNKKSIQLFSGGPIPNISLLKELYKKAFPNKKISDIDTKIQDTMDITLYRRSQKKLQSYVKECENDYVTYIQPALQKVLNKLESVDYDSEGYLSNTTNVEMMANTLSILGSSIMDPRVSTGLALSSAFIDI